MSKEYTQTPIDTATGAQSSSPVHFAAAGDDVIVGYLVTLPDGFTCRLGPDKTRAMMYYANQRAMSIEAMYVKREKG